MAETNKAPSAPNAKAPSSPAGKTSQPGIKRNASSPQGYKDGNKNILMAAIGMFVLSGMFIVYDQLREENEDEKKNRKDEEQEVKRQAMEANQKLKAQQQRVEMLKRQAEAAAAKAAGGH